jgi:1-acyl-sn-glycerol-3-phosphate acyltransferase
MFKLIFRLAGWKITHYLPDDIKKCVVVVAPHTSNWDFIFGMGAIRYMRIFPRFAIKKEWLRFPFRRLMEHYGALPVDRGPKKADGGRKGTVDAMAALFETHDTLRLIITPEGTRKRVERWRTGFYFVALKAQVPLALGFMDYSKRECGIDKIIYPTGDFKADMKQIMDFYAPMKGRHPENFTTDIDLS